MKKEEKKVKKNEENKKKKKIINIIIYIIAITCLITMTISIKNIIEWKIDNDKTKKQVSDLQEKTEVVEKQDDENTEIIEQVEEIPKSNPYWDYIYMPLIDVDFNELKALNADTVGWIKVEGTIINYPFVQSKDNNYYLRRSYDKSYNTGGWIFLDYRNNINKLGRNTIIYGHDRKDDSMFGSLSNVYTKSWQKDKNNHIIKISTPTENTMWQIFSIYHLPATSDYIKTSFKNDDEFQSFLNMITNRTMYNFGTKATVNDKILTLSTCYGSAGKERTVVHAKLIKREIKNTSEN